MANPSFETTLIEGVLKPNLEQPQNSNEMFGLTPARVAAVYRGVLEPS